MTEIKINTPAEDTPTEQVVKKAAKTVTFTDSQGREIVMRKLSAMDKLNLFKIVGNLQSNEGYFSYLMTAYHVVSIDAETVPKGTVGQLEFLVQRLGDSMDDVALKMTEMYAGDEATVAAIQEAIKNAQGTKNL